MSKFPILYSPQTQTGLLGNRFIAKSLWFGLSLAAVIQDILRNKLNNFLIFRSVYFHLTQGRNLYLFYPSEYGDVNLYGPVFGNVIMPFALLPVQLGALCWVMANVIFLYWAISKLPLERFYQTVLVFLCSHELMNNSSWLQSNALVCGCIMLGFSFTVKGREKWALFYIMLATFIKLYGVIGLAFIPFSMSKRRFLWSAFVWTVLFFLLPLILTNEHFLFQSYRDWYTGLALKDAKNIRIDTDNWFQDISFMGVIRRSVYPGLRNLYVLVPAVIFYLSQFIYVKRYKHLNYQLYILCSSLLFVVIFSTGAESPTYIIALPAMCIWFFLQPIRNATNWLFGLFLVFTTFSYSDLLTPWFRHHIAMPYSLKAIPASIIWLVIVCQIHLGMSEKLLIKPLWVSKSPS